MAADAGTEVTFLPSPNTFTMVEFDYPTLEHRLRELAFLNSGAKIMLTDNRHADSKTETMMYEGGVAAFVQYLDKARSALIGEPVMLRGEKDGITVEIALWWNDSYPEQVLCFTNNIPQRDGGTHLAGFRAALTRVINKYAERIRHRQERESRPHRRRQPRGARPASCRSRFRIRNSPARPKTSWSRPRSSRWSRT